MKILTRKVGETLMIGDGITITVIEVKGNQVHIGVNEPKDIHERIRNNWDTVNKVFTDDSTQWGE